MSLVVVINGFLSLCRAATLALCDIPSIHGHIRTTIHGHNKKGQPYYCQAGLLCGKGG
jgi:hypothetical protein